MSSSDLIGAICPPWCGGMRSHYFSGRLRLKPHSSQTKGLCPKHPEEVVQPCNHEPDPQSFEGQWRGAGRSVRVGTEAQCCAKSHIRALFGNQGDYPTVRLRRDFPYALSKFCGCHAVAFMKRRIPCGVAQPVAVPAPIVSPWICCGQRREQESYGVPESLSPNALFLLSSCHLL